MVNEMYELEEGEILERPNGAVQSVDELLACAHGGLMKAADTASRYVELLVYTVKSGSIRNLSVVLMALLETNHKSVLRGIVKANGVHALFHLLRLHEKSFQMTPVLRSALRVLQHLEGRGALRGGDLTCCAPHFCVAEFSRAVFRLTHHSDPRVRTLAATFQKLRFDMARHHPSHDQCGELAQQRMSTVDQHIQFKRREARKPILKMEERIRRRRHWNQINHAISCQPIS